MVTPEILYKVAQNLNKDNETLLKLAWTARDVNQLAWRAAGGFAKEITPWRKAFSSGLTPKIEESVVNKLSTKPSMLSKTISVLKGKYIPDEKRERMLGKYTNMLADRSKKVYTGNNIGRSAGISPYKNLGKPIKEVDPVKAMYGINDGNWKLVQDAIASKKTKGIKGSIFEGEENSSGVISRFDNTGKVTEHIVNYPKLEHTDTNSDVHRKLVIMRHETEELRTAPDAYKVTKIQNGGLPDVVTKNNGVGSHNSMKVLHAEQVALRDAPDNVYNDYVQTRLKGKPGISRDWDKMEYIKDKGKIDIKDYGSDLRYRPKEVKQVDNFANAANKKYYDKQIKYTKFHNNIGDNFVHRSMLDTNTPASTLRNTEKYIKVRKYLDSRIKRTFNPTWYD